MKLAFIGSKNKIMLSCTYCWQAHTGHEYNGEVLVFGGCGHDPRRYFSDHDDYTAYVRAYRAAGNDHEAALAAVGRATATLPLFEGYYSDGRYGT